VPEMEFVCGSCGLMKLEYQLESLGPTFLFATSSPRVLVFVNECNQHLSLER
jgi:hypothetical protein